MFDAPTEVSREDGEEGTDCSALGFEPMAREARYLLPPSQPRTDSGY